jgi:hypothetical protein
MRRGITKGNSINAYQNYMMYGPGAFGGAGGERAMRIAIGNVPGSVGTDPLATYNYWRSQNTNPLGEATGPWVGWRNNLTNTAANQTGWQNLKMINSTPSNSQTNWGPTAVGAGVGAVTGIGAIGGGLLGGLMGGNTKRKKLPTFFDQYQTNYNSPLNAYKQGVLPAQTNWDKYMAELNAINNRTFDASRYPNSLPMMERFNENAWQDQNASDRKALDAKYQRDYEEAKYQWRIDTYGLTDQRNKTHAQPMSMCRSSPECTPCTIASIPAR